MKIRLYKCQYYGARCLVQLFCYRVPQIAPNMIVENVLDSALIAPLCAPFPREDQEDPVGSLITGVIGVMRNQQVVAAQTLGDCLQLSPVHSLQRKAPQDIRVCNYCLLWALSAVDGTYLGPSGCRGTTLMCFPTRPGNPKLKFLNPKREP